MNRIPSRLIILCVDGSSSSGDIADTLKEACRHCGMALNTTNFKYSGSTKVCISTYFGKVRNLVEKNGNDPSRLCLLIIGKSLGGAKMYRFFFRYAGYLKRFKKVALLLVDAHEPIVPGDEGGCYRWYDYVCFSSPYHLKWWEERWGPAAKQFAPSAQLRVYSIYQRNNWPRGYGMPEAFRCENLTGKSVLSYADRKPAPADHWNIACCDKTMELMVEAIEFFKNVERRP